MAVQAQCISWLAEDLLQKEEASIRDCLNLSKLLGKENE